MVLPQLVPLSPCLFRSKHRSGPTTAPGRRRPRLKKTLTQPRRRLKFCPREGGAVTWPEHPPAVVLVRGTLAVVAVALRLVVAGFAVHLEAVFGTLLRGSGAVFSQVALACRRPADTSRLLELRVETQTFLSRCFTRTRFSTPRMGRSLFPVFRAIEPSL